MWEQIDKSHRITAKVVVADKCSLADFKAALDFTIIVMLIITLLYQISIVADAVDAASDLRWCLRCCK